MWYLTIAIILFILTFVGGMVYMKKTDEELFGWFDADDLQEVDGLLMYSLACFLQASGLQRCRSVFSTAFWF